MNNIKNEDIINNLIKDLTTYISYKTVINENKELIDGLNDFREIYQKYEIENEIKKNKKKV